MSNMNDVMKELFQKYGTDVIAKLREEDIVNVPVCSTGVDDVDKAVGIGGWPLGRIVEIFGPESTGKTTLAILSAAQAQKTMKKPVLFIDFEHALNLSYAESLGLDTSPELFVLSQPDYLEQGFDVVLQFVKSKLISCVVIDTVAAALPKVEFEGEVDGSGMATHARAISKMLRLLISEINKSKSVALFLNQERTFGIGGFSTYLESTGGKFLKFAASIRVRVKKLKTIKRREKNDQDEIVSVPYANEMLFVVVKNKLARPYSETTQWLVLGKGIFPPHPRKKVE